MRDAEAGRAGPWGQRIADAASDCRGACGGTRVLAVAVIVFFLVRLVSAAEATPEALRDRAVAILRQTLGDGSPAARIAAAEYLLRLEYPQGVCESLRRKALDGDALHRAAVWRVMALAAVDQRDSAELIAKIARMAFDRRSPARSAAMESLALLGFRPTASERRQLEEIAADAGDPAAAAAAWVLLDSGEASGEAEARLAALVGSSDDAQRAAAARALFHAPPLTERSRSAIHAALARQRSPSAARVALAAAAARHGPPAERPQRLAELTAALGRGPPERRVEACRYLAALAGPEQRAELVALLDDPDDQLRAAAAWALLRLERRRPRGLGWLDAAVIAAYGLAMLAIGWHYWRRTDTREDYLLGGRRMRSLPVGLSLFATLFSTISYLAWPGEMIKNGPMILAAAAAYPFVALVGGYLIIPRIMAQDITSAYELLERRLGLSVRLLGSTLFLLLRLLWMSVISYAMAAAVLVPLLGLPVSSIPAICAAVALVTLVYTAMGGLRADVVTDVLQTVILFSGAIASLLAITTCLGGFSAWWPDHWYAHWAPPTLYDPTARVTLVGAMAAMFVWYVSTLGSDQMAIQRYLATRDAPAARRMLNISLLASAAVFVLLAALGLALLAYFRARPQALPDERTIYANADQLFTWFITGGLPPGFSGLVVAGLLSAAMSSLSSGINSASAVVTSDFFDRLGWRRPAGGAGRGGARFERLVSVAIGLLVVLLSSGVGVVHGNLLEIAYKVVNLLSAPLFGLFFMALFVPWANGPGTLIGAAAGLAVVVLVNFWHELTGAPGVSFLWAMPLSFPVQIGVGMLASRLTSPKASAA